MYEVPEELLKLPDQVSNKDTGTRLETALDARRLFTCAMQEDKARSLQRAIVKGCYDGNAPYNQRKLNEQGRSWEANLNFMGLEGTVDSARIPYYALFSGVPYYANFKTNHRPEESNAAKWDMKTAELFTDLLNRWKKFKWNMQASQFEMLFEGWGPIVFDDVGDWRFRAIPARHVLVPQESESCLSKDMPWIIIIVPYRVHQLYDFIRNEKGASKKGWNVENVQQAILRGTRGYGGNSSQTWKDQPWEKWQQQFKNKELMASYTDCDIVKCAHVFVKEYSGKISQKIFTVDEVYSKDAKNNEIGFLFEDNNRFDEYHQVLNVAFQNTGDGTWHSVRGVGLKSFKHEEVRNRLDCRIINNVFLGSSLVLAQGDAKSNQKLQLMVNGAVTMIPPGTTLQQQRLNGDIEGPLAVSRYLQNQLAQKVGNYQQRSISRDDGRGEMPTKAQVELQAAKESSLTGAQIDNYYLDLDCIYSEVFRRVMKSSDPEAKRFRDECEKAGIPKEALDNMQYVRANRLSGYGSPQMRKMAMQESMPLVPMFNEKGKQAWLNEAIATVGGADKVQSWNPPMEEPDIDEAMAVLENDSLHNGSVPLVISGMDNVAHLFVHLQDAEERLGPLRQAVEEGQEVPPDQLQEAFIYVSALGPHCQDHLSRIENDPSRKDVVQEFEGQLKLLTSFHGKLRSAIRSAAAKAAQEARENQRAQVLSALDEAKLQSAQLDMQLKTAKTQNDIKIKNEKAVNQTNLKRWQAGQQNQLNTAKTVEDIRLGRIKTAADVNQKRLNEQASRKSNGK